MSYTDKHEPQYENTWKNPMSYTHSSEDFRVMALKCARGRYQRNLVEGNESWNGSTLRGKARAWISRYRASRDALLVRLKKADLDVVISGGTATIVPTRRYIVKKTLADNTRPMADRVAVVLSLGDST